MPKRAHEPVNTGQQCAEPCCVKKTWTTVSSFLTAMTLLSTAQAVPQDVGQSMQKVVDQEVVEHSPLLLTLVSEEEERGVKEETSAKTKKRIQVFVRCVHGYYRKDLCVPCAGSGICEHMKRRIRCVKCNPCPHGKFKDQCKNCHGSALCVHKRQKEICKEGACKGAAFCEHGRRKMNCKEGDCHGSNICVHGRLKQQCKDEACKGAAFCEHGRRKVSCKEGDCHGSNICVHGKQKQQCKDGACKGCVFCPHGQYKKRCHEESCMPWGMLV